MKQLWLALFWVFASSTGAALNGLIGPKAFVVIGSLFLMMLLAAGEGPIRRRFGSR
ncbi:MAG TPA: hypothetical protein VFW87_13265 [Pirellulales bacterium]|nr:hypothetical protein [Pirellulales bacterium]